MSTKNNENASSTAGDSGLLILRTLLQGADARPRHRQSHRINSDEVLQVGKVAVSALHRHQTRLDFRGRRTSENNRPGQILPADGQGPPATGGRDQQMDKLAGAIAANSSAAG